MAYAINDHLAIVIDSPAEPVTGLESDTQSELIDIHHYMASALRACSRVSASTGGHHRAEIAT